MVDLTEKRIAILSYANRHNGITLREATENVYGHKSTASEALKKLTENEYLNVIRDTPVYSSYNKLWIISEKGEKMLEALDS